MKNIHFVFTVLFCLLFAVGLTASEAGPANTDGFSVEMSTDIADFQAADLQFEIEDQPVELFESAEALPESEISESNHQHPSPALIRTTQDKRMEPDRLESKFIYHPSKIMRYDKVTTAPPAYSNWYAVRGYWPQ